MNLRKKLPRLLLPCLLAAFLILPALSGTALAAKDAGQTLKGKWVKKSGAYKYRYSDKTYAGPGFQKIGNYWYYFDKDKRVSTGWITVGSKRYYASKSKTTGKRGRLFTGWHTIKGKIYYFSPKGKAKTYGKMLTGWQVINENTYYLSKEGALQTGWQKIGGKYFYFLPKGKNGVKGKMVTGWYKIKKKKYYFRPSGKTGVKGARYKSEWVTVEGTKYYFNSNGSMNPNTMTESEFISKIGELASKDMKKSRILASVTTAQAILESGYGTTSLAMEAHNLFGMKANLSNNAWKSSWKGKTFTKTTKEYLNKKWYTITDTFRSYGSFAESLTDHSNYLTYAQKGDELRYKGVVGNKNYKKTIQIIKKGGYATDPDYVSKICNIIKKYNLTKYDK